MATMATTFTASGSFSLVDETGTTIFSYSPSFTTVPNTTAQVLYSGEHLAQTGGSELALGDINPDRVYCFIKHVDTDYAIEVECNEQEGTAKEMVDLKPGECFFSPVDIDGAGDSSANLDLAATTAAQKVQYLLCDGLDN